MSIAQNTIWGGGGLGNCKSETCTPVVTCNKHTIFLYGLLNNEVSSSACVVSSSGMVSE